MDRIKEIERELDRIYQFQTDLYHAYASYCGLSDTAFWLLYTLYGTEETYTQNQIADLWHMPRQSVNSAAAALVRAGYLSLEKLLLARNNKALRLTEAGRAFCRRAIAPFYAAEEEMLMRLSEAERERLLTLSNKACLYLKEGIEAAMGKNGEGKKEQE